MSAEHPKYNASILVVEDVEMMQEIERGLLSLFECKVDFVSDGEEALEQFNSNAYDLVFLDLQLPGIDGYEVAKRLREIETKKNNGQIPIVVITASTLSSDQQNELSVSVTDYLFKPINLNSFAGVLKKYLSDKEV